MEETLFTFFAAEKLSQPEKPTQKNKRFESKVYLKIILRKNIDFTPLLYFYVFMNENIIWKNEKCL